MKFACETCQTKYVIPDERVAGRLLRVRCKRCRGVMEVLGPATDHNRATTKAEKLSQLRGQDVADDRPMFSMRRGGGDPFDNVNSGPFGSVSNAGGNVSTSGLEVRSDPGRQVMPPPPAASAEWHVAIKGQSRGPFTDEEMQLLAVRSRIHARTRVWRAGMDGWVRLEDVTDLAFLNPHLRPREQRASGELSMPPPTPAPVLDEVTGMAEAPGWDHQAGKPFANLVASHNLATQPPPAPAGETTNPKGVISAGHTGWFKLSDRDLEQLLLEDRPQVQGTTPLYTGTHLLRRRSGALAWGLLTAVLLVVATVTVVMLPMLLDSRVETAVAITDPTARSPAALAAPLAADAQGTHLANIKAMGGAPMPAPVAGTPEARATVAPSEAQPPRKARALERVRSAIHRAAEALRQ